MPPPHPATPRRMRPRLQQRRVRPGSRRNSAAPCSIAITAASVCCPSTSRQSLQRLRRRVRRLLGEIMPAVEGKAAHVDRPFAPGRERTLGLGPYAAGGTPNREQRTGDLLARRARFLVVDEIGGAAGAIVLAGRVDAQ